MALMLSEIKQRIRGKRWWILLALWTLVLAGLTFLVRMASVASLENARRFDVVTGDVPIGPAMFGSLMLFTLTLICLVVPSLTSTSINSERDRGTLAVLQATLLRPHEIFAAKFMSGMAVSLAFLFATIPLTLWSMAEGGVGVGRSLIVYLLLSLVCAVLLSVGLAMSTFLRRPALSAVMSYAVVFLLTIGTLIVFGLALLTAPTRTVRVDDEFGGYTTEEKPIGWRWVLLSPNPVVVLSDAAPRSESRFIPDPLDAIRTTVRESRRPAGTPGFAGLGPEPPPLWPVGLAIEVVLAGAAAYATVGRLRIPARRLAPGQRVA